MQTHCAEEYLLVFTRRFPACVFISFHILKGNAGVKYYTDVVLLVSRGDSFPKFNENLIFNNQEHRNIY